MTYAPPTGNVRRIVSKIEGDIVTYKQAGLLNRQPLEGFAAWAARETPTKAHALGPAYGSLTTSAKRLQ